MKWLASLVLFLAVTLLLRSTALTALAARGVLIDVLAFATVVWALRHDESLGTGFGFALGLAADLDAGRWIGRHALVLALIGYIVGRGSRSLVRESARTQAVLFFLATAARTANGALRRSITSWPPSAPAAIRRCTSSGWAPMSPATRRTHSGPMIRRVSATLSAGNGRNTTLKLGALSASRWPLRS